jgi:MFS family permease
MNVKKSLVISVIAGMSGMSWFAVAFGIPTIMLFESLTANATIIGIFTTLPYLTSVFQIPSVIIAENFAGRKLYWGIISMIHRILWLTPVILILCLWNQPNLAVLILLFVIALSSCCGQASAPIWQDWMADIIPEEVSEKYWGIWQTFTTMAFLISTMVSGMILDSFPSPEKGGSYTGFLIVFVFGAFLGILDIALFLRIPDIKKVSTHKTSNIIEKIILPMKNPNFRYMTFAFAFWYLIMSIIGPFPLLYLKRSFSVNYFMLSVISVSSSLGTVIFGFFNGLIIKKIGARIYFCTAMALIPLLWTVFFFLNPDIMEINLWLLHFEIQSCVVTVAAIWFIGGIFASGVIICQFHMINVLAERQWRGMGIAVHWVVIGLIASGGAFVGGALTDYFTKFPLETILPSGQNFTYIHILLIIGTLIAWGVATPFMLNVRPKKEEMSFPYFISTTFAYPMRGLSIIYNFSIDMSSVVAGRKKPQK